MSLYELRDLFIDSCQMVRIYDSLSDADLVYEGSFDDMPEWLENVEIGSIDNLFKGNDGYLGINVSLEEEEE